jgi:hypothetical protein
LQALIEFFTQNALSLDGNISITGKVSFARVVFLSTVSFAIGSVMLTLLPLQRAVAQKMPANSTSHCHVGTYHLSDGRDVDIAPDDENLEWHMKDGTIGELAPTADGSWSSTLGWTERPDGERVSFGRLHRRQDLLRRSRGPPYSL